MYYLNFNKKYIVWRYYGIQKERNGFKIQRKQCPVVDALIQLVIIMSSHVHDMDVGRDTILNKTY